VKASEYISMQARFNAQCVLEAAMQMEPHVAARVLREMAQSQLLLADAVLRIGRDGNPEMPEADVAKLRRIVNAL
jgi:hypothetical protein